MKVFSISEKTKSSDPILAAMEYAEKISNKIGSKLAAQLTEQIVEDLRLNIFEGNAYCGTCFTAWFIDVKDSGCYVFCEFTDFSR